MPMTSKRAALRAACIAFAWTLVSTASAQDYPNRPIRVIMPLGPGGIGDVYLRALAQSLHKRLGQPVVVENKPGAATTIGANACALSNPDGYTYCLLSIDSISLAPHLFPNLPYDLFKQLVPLTRLFFIVQGLMVHPSLGVNTPAELAALSKSKPGTLSYATQGSHITLFMEEFKRVSGADLQRVPFTAGGQATAAVVSGQVPVGYFGIGNLLQQIQVGQVKMLAVDGTRRSDLYPAAPTLTETGFSGVSLRPWYALFAPAGTPQPYIDRIYREVINVMQDPDFLNLHVIARGLDPALQPADAFRDFMKEDVAQAGRLVENAGLKP